MPDLERITRAAELHFAGNSHQREIIRARHQGEDKARREIAYAAVFAAAIYIIFKISI